MSNNEHTLEDYMKKGRKDFISFFSNRIVLIRKKQRILNFLIFLISMGPKSQMFENRVLAICENVHCHFINTNS